MGAFATPDTPNLPDFSVFVLNQNVPGSALPNAVGSVSINNGGSGYTSPPSVVFSAPATGVTATGTAVIANGIVTGITIVLAGSGYLLEPSITFSGGGGTGAVATANLSPFDALDASYNYAFAKAIEPAPQIPGVIYALAVYNYAMHQLLKICPDQPAGNGYFQNLRDKYKLLDFLGGVISGSNDQNTGQSIAVSESLKDLPLEMLDLLKTPWGRQYLEYAQMYGPTIIGVS